jgi:hypothetical protein
MPEDTDTENEPKMIGRTMVLTMTDLGRAKEMLGPLCSAKK